GVVMVFVTFGLSEELLGRIGIEFFFSSRRRHTRWPRDWSSDVCSSDLCLVSRQFFRLFHEVRVNRLRRAGKPLRPATVVSDCGASSRSPKSPFLWCCLSERGS